MKKQPQVKRILLHMAQMDVRKIETLHNTRAFYGLSLMLWMGG